MIIIRETAISRSIIGHLQVMITSLWVMIMIIVGEKCSTLLDNPYTN